MSLTSLAYFVFQSFKREAKSSEIFKNSIEEETGKMALDFFP